MRHAICINLELCSTTHLIAMNHGVHAGLVSELQPRTYGGQATRRRDRRVSVSANVGWRYYRD